MLLLATARLGSGAHGLAIRTELDRATGRTVSPGAVYSTMDRLARQGLVDAFIGDESPATGGRRRKFYRLTATGARILERDYRSLTRLAQGVMPRVERLAEDEVD
jgi:DNA-binding PadR family transcriptional regulator